MSIDFLRYLVWGEHAALIALIISIAIESLFVLLCARSLRLDGRLLAMVAIAGTLITHPILWNLFIHLSSDLSFEVRSVMLEIPVFLVEGMMYKLATPYDWKVSMVLSFGANLTSYLCGLSFYNFLNR